MRLDIVIVLILALLFFGGVAFLAWRQRKNQKLLNSKIPASSDSGEQQGVRRRRNKY